MTLIAPEAIDMVSHSMKLFASAQNVFQGGSLIAQSMALTLALTHKRTRTRTNTVISLSLSHGGHHRCDILIAKVTFGRHCCVVTAIDEPFRSKPILFDEIRTLLTNHDDWSIGITAADGRHDARIDDSKCLDAVDP